MPANDFRVIPVLDILNGQAVHAVAGKRSHYRPIQSILHPTSEPEALALAYREQLGLENLYVADLDAILHARPNAANYRRLAALGLDLWIDAGIQDVTDATELLELPAVDLVTGLETIGGPAALDRILEKVGSDRVVFSLDMRDGSLLANGSAGWSTLEPLEFCRQRIAQGVRRWLLLDLARVGTGRGTGTETLLTRIPGLAPADVRLEIYVGGGIAGIDQLAAARSAGAAGVLVGSALNDGRITRPLLERVSGKSRAGSP